MTLIAAQARGPAPVRTGDVPHFPAGPKYVTVRTLGGNSKAVIE